MEKRNTSAKKEKSVVAITRGGRWEAQKVIERGFDLIGGIRSVVKRGDVVLLKPNLGYPEVPGMPPWTCTTDARVLAALTTLCLEAGAKKVRTGDMPAHHVRSSYMLAATGVQEAVEKVGGEVVCLDEEPFITRKVPGGILLKKQALPKAVLDADVIINVPKIKPTRVGKWTLAFKNLFGLLPHEDRMERHRIPEHFYILTDLWRLVKPALTIMDGFVIQEGLGPRLGDPVDFGVVIMGKDPVATEAVTVSAIGHEPYEQMVVPIADKQGLGKSDLNQIEIRGESLESVRRYTKVSPGDLWLNASPNVVEYFGGACWGCGFWIQYTPYPWEIDKKKKYALIVGNRPRLPDKFTEDEIIVMGTCATRSRNQILKACPKGVTPKFIGGCPPYWQRAHGYYESHKIDQIPRAPKANFVDEGDK
jgi:uncharacterized protein (DUF362 family)